MNLRCIFAGVLAVAGIACGGASSQGEVKAATAVYNPLSVCRTSHMSRYARGAACPGANLLFVSREPSPSELLERTRLNLQSYGVSTKDEKLAIAGQQLPALSYVMGAPSAPTVGMLFTALPVPGSSESFEAQCYAYGAAVDPKPCTTLLQAFVDQGLLRGEWPRALSDARPQESIVVRLPGREVRLPWACDELAPLDVQCKEGHVRAFVASDPAHLPRIKEVELAGEADPTLVRQWAVPCRIEGVPTECTVRKYGLPFADELWAFYATAVVKNQPLFVSCNTRRSFSHIMPGPICNQFISFEDGALAEPTTKVIEE